MPSGSVVAGDCQIEPGRRPVLPGPGLRGLERRYVPARAERELDAARAELARARQDTSAQDTGAPARRRRTSRAPEGS